MFMEVEWALLHAPEERSGGGGVEWSGVEWKRSGDQLRSVCSPIQEGISLVVSDGQVAAVEREVDALGHADLR